MKNIYLIATTPPPALAEEIDSIRKDCSRKYECYAALKPPVHLTLKENFELRSHEETKLIRTLKSAALNNQPFTQSLNNFDKFFNHTIYIKGNKALELANLKKNIVRNIKRHFGYVQNEKYSFNPHVTIAYRDIPEQNFNPAFEEYKAQTFNAESMQSIRII